MTRGWIATWLALLIALIAPAPAWAQHAAGEWHGQLTVGATTLRIEVTITQAADGSLSGTMGSPDQGGEDLKLTNVTFAGTDFSFDAPSIDGRYAAHWDAAAGNWAGSWTQGVALPLVLSPGKETAISRPQEPKPPFPYVEQDVAIDSVAGVRLSCTFTRPAATAAGAGTVPAAVLVTGSGAQDRDEALFGHKPFAVLADHLTRAGIAVLRCDDRGTARSTGVFGTALTRDFADDAHAALAWLRRQNGIGKVGLIGHSEGGLVGPMVAERDPKLGFLVLLAGPGIPMADLLAAQSVAISRAMGEPPEKGARNGETNRRLVQAVIAAPSGEAAKAAATRILIEDGMSPEQAASQAGPVASPWFRSIAAYDPRPPLARLRVPLLALNGGTDTQVPAAANLAAIREATRDNRDVTIVELPGLNHLFQTSATGSPADYGKIAETFSPKALTLISDWILKHR
ncbi:alpha/beta fold hydrolase [Sphingomonas sp. HF-S3]|uniref:Alpha/beta fold hydrolase n=1 Tax=Sphingomonas rustica TaxID=3103142 RepID=A0ABV0BHT1_9SPHN